MNKLKKYKLLVLSFLSALLANCMGIVFREKIMTSGMLPWVLAISALIPAFFLFFSTLASISLKKRYNVSEIEQIHQTLLQSRANARETAVSRLKILKRVRLAGDLWAIPVWICAVLLSAMFGAVAVGTGKRFDDLARLAVSPLLVYSTFCFYASYLRIRRLKDTKLQPDQTYLPQEQYPALYALANRAAQELGCRYRIAVFLSDGFGISISKQKKQVFLTIGVFAHSVLTEEEMYAIFLHEFYHVSKEPRIYSREQAYFGWITSHPVDDCFPPEKVLTCYYQFFDILYALHYFVFDYATSVMVEQDADSAMKKCGAPEIPVSALLKLHYFDLFNWESMGKNDTPLYAPEEPRPDHFASVLQEYREAVAERSDDWNAMLNVEIIANNASHPTTRMRADALGVKELRTVPSRTSEQYRKEAEQLLEYTDGLVYKDRMENYADARENSYLFFLNKIREWKDAGSPVTPEGYADILDSFMELCDRDAALELCDRALDLLPEGASWHAHFVKGTILLHRYDPAGMEHLYTAVKNNSNYFEDGLDIMGTYCCMTGNEEELLKYRAFAEGLQQKHFEQDEETSKLLPGDRLTKDDMPEEMRERILSFILSLDPDGIIRKVYLVRKHIGEDFFTSAFIIYFYGGTDEARHEIMHKIFRYLDSSPDNWQFSLFDYFECQQIRLDKIPGSLIYERN